MPESTQNAFETWAVVELFGHNVIAGKVSEQVVAGTGFVRVDVPEISNIASYSRLFGGSAIYSITPCSEEIARQYAENLRARPIVIYQVSLPAQIGQEDDGGEEEAPF